MKAWGDPPPGPRHLVEGRACGAPPGVAGKAEVPSPLWAEGLLILYKFLVQYIGANQKVTTKWELSEGKLLRYEDLSLNIYHSGS